MIPAHRPVSVPELRTQRDGSRRSIPWEALDPSSLEPGSRQRVGANWRARMRQEHLAVGAFSLLTHELANLGAEPIVLSLVARAAADEVRHTEICRRMATAFLGARAVPSRYRGTPNVPKHRSSTPAERTLFHVVEMCCLSETLAGVLFAEMRKRTTNPAAVAAMESLLEDEIDHGRVGWAYLASLGDKHADFPALSSELPALLERTVGRTLETSHKSEPDDPALEAFAYLGNDSVTRLTRGALRDVILPGFDVLGIDTRAAREHAGACGWL